jgi:haloalkane dehalogenase
MLIFPRILFVCLITLLASCTDASTAATEDAFSDGPSRQFADYEAGRYCEVLVARLGPSGGLIAEVWNSLAFGDCPQADWEQLDSEQIKGELDGAILVVLNGPRFFLMQEIVQNGSDPQEQATGLAAQEYTFGAIKMALAATVLVNPADAGPYKPNYVQRQTTFRFKSGHRVFELHDDQGQAYVMQSFSRIEDANLTYEQLSDLGSRLTLPTGWTFSTRVLEQDLSVTATGTATVIQDDLTCSYQLVEQGQR